MTDVAKAAETVRLTIDGVEVEAPKGALVIRAAEQLGIAIPRFCDHPLLKPAGACRQCLVEVEGQRKPVASCTQTVAEGMVVRTQLTSEVAKKAQAGIMELLLINHPLDCPMCDKGGECPLQNQAISTGRAETRFHEHKREYPKPIPISTQVLLDRERCVLCQRCTRFSEEIAGDTFIDLMDRSSAEQIGIYRDSAFEAPAELDTIGEPGYPQGPMVDERRAESVRDEPFNSYFSGNTVQICPVGALTGAQYRFRARPFDLVSTPGVCEHCAAGCAQRTDHRRGKVTRRLAGNDPDVNEEWNCDKGRWGFRYATATDRITTPLLRDADTGELRTASWPEALRAAAAGLGKARDGAGVGVLTGGRLTVEDAFAYAKFARVVLRTNDVDFRARPIGADREEADLLASLVAGADEVTYRDVDTAPAVVLVGLEPEEECPILFLRLRKAHQKNKLAVHAIAPFASRGLGKLGAKVVPAVPGAEPDALAEDSDVRTALTKPGALLLVGERLASVPGGFSAAAKLAEETGARLAWVPRRAGDRGAVETGCLPNLLPGGRLVIDPAARAEIATAWRLETGVISSTVGKDTDAMIAAAAAGRLDALVVAGVDPDDLADPALAEQALDTVGFLVSLEVRHSAVTSRADVVFPVAPVQEKAGAFLDWEGRSRTFPKVFDTAAISDARVLDALAAACGHTLGCGDVDAIRHEMNSLSTNRSTVGPRPRVGSVVPVTSFPPAAGSAPGADEAILATWHQLLDLGRLLAGDDILAGTARTAKARLPKSLASALDLADGDQVRVSTDRGGITLPVEITEMPDGVVWVPTNSAGSTVHRTLGVTAGAQVRVSRIDVEVAP